MSIRTIALIGGLAVSIPIALSLLPKASGTIVIGNPKLYFHIKDSPEFNTRGNVQEFYNNLLQSNNTGLDIGLEPQTSGDWLSQLSYFNEFSNIPIMLNAITSDDSYILTTQQIREVTNICPVRYLRFHEIISYYGINILPQVYEILTYARDILNIPVFWNEWDVNTFPTISTVASQGFQNTIVASFGTNSGYYEPVEGYSFLQNFQRKGASVQSWYWWERKERVNGSELLMPPELFIQHTREAFQAGCEVVQFEPYSYLRYTYQDILGGIII